VGGGISFSRVKVEFLLLGNIIKVTFEHKSSVLVILKLVHQYLLISLVSFIIEDQNTSQAIQNSTLFKVVVDLEILMNGI
jgi:hypothetical protein